MSGAQHSTARQSFAESMGEDTASNVARLVRDAGMAGPAIVALHAFKPLAWFGSQFLWMLQPFIGHARWKSNRGRRFDDMGASRSSYLSVPQLAALLEDEHTLNRLIEQLALAQDGADLPAPARPALDERCRR